MKILPVDKIREADAHTIQFEPIRSIDLMERAATQCFRWIKKHVDRTQRIKIFCGPGNNGGDGLVIARLLAGKDYEVEVWIVRFTEKGTDDFNINLKRLDQTDIKNLGEIREGDLLPVISNDDVVIDAIFGSGLSRPVNGFTAKLIQHINKSGAITIAIDTPSGLFSDENSTQKGGAVVEADYTLSFQFPKYAFLFPENDRFVGEWHILPIGLMEEYTAVADVRNYFVENLDAVQLIKPRNKFDHKGTFGHALLIAGGYGKMGAALMAAKAALRTGAGLVSAHVPLSGYPIIQTALPECMVSIDEDLNVFSRHPELGLYNAIAVGPGLGMEKVTQNALKLLIQNANLPILFDADAINILGENKTWISFVKAGSIFTPHPKEFERLVGKSSNNFERNKMQREFSTKNKVYVVLKGAHTCISTPEGNCFFNSTGNPGMATGGSGDVLTGIILGLLSQYYHPQEACILGVYLHGLAGDIAAGKNSQQALIAGDITENLGKAFRKIQ
ncbi:MAG: NAD(P)H-hydrate dehydratase [Bacteroidales bacterium]|nr:NAD(P)H-hydrate dehydratase [Bacteroidales bacterium]